MARVKQQHPTVRVSVETHSLLRQLADDEQIPMSEVIERAVERYRRQRILERAGEVWSRMMEDPETARFWAEEDAAIEAAFGSWTEHDEVERG